VKARWTTKPLSEVCTFKPQKSEARAKLTSEDVVSFVPMENLGIGSKELTLTGTRPLSEVAGSYTYFAEGDVLLAKITPCFENGKLGIARNLVNGVGFGSSEYIVIRPGPEVDADFLYHFLDRATFREEGAKQMTGAVGHKRVPKEYVEGALIPVPTIGEQRRIVTLLDEAFADIATAKANAEKNLQNARAMMDSELEGLFANQGHLWQEMPLSQIGQTQTGSTPKTSEPANYGDHLPFIKPGDFNIDGSLDYENEGLSALGARSAREVAAHSVLMVCIGATIGKCGYTDQVVATNQQINALKPNAGHNPKFIYYQMLSSRFQKKVMHGSGQATLPIINKSKWSALTLRMPDPDEQTRIVKRLDDLSSQCRALESIYRQKLTVLDDLKKSLLHQAFNGQL